MSEQTSWWMNRYSTKYLGTVVTQDGGFVKEIKTRVAIAKNAFNEIKSLVNYKSNSISLRKRFIKSYVLFTLVYGYKA